MGTMRGLIPSLGAGGSLIAASLCALVLFGGLFAFRGDAPGTADANSGDLTMPAADVRAATDVGDTAPPARAIRRAARTVDRPRVRRSAAVAVPVPTAAPRLRAPTRTAAPPTPVPAPATPAAPAAEAPGTVERTVEQARALAEPVVDAVPAPADPVADTVEQVAATVDGVTGALLP